MSHLVLELLPDRRHQVVKDELLGEAVEREHGEHCVAKLKDECSSGLEEQRHRLDEPCIIFHVRDDPERDDSIELTHSIGLGVDRIPIVNVHLGV